MIFIHTADWQIGKPFAGIGDAHKRSLVQQERIEAIKRIGGVAQEHGAAFVLVAGDLFDSPSADKATVSAACSAIGQIGVPVLAIPGNHDHAGPGSVWEQAFFQRERDALAPNLRVLLEVAPVELDAAVILPCPLLRRAVMADPTDWLRTPEAFAGLSPDKPRIVLAHGSTQTFSRQWADDEEGGGAAANLLDLSRLPVAEIDYIALGDWHGTKQIDAKAWYAGTPELDRFPKGGEHDPGNVLVVEARRGAAPLVARVATSRLRWRELTFDFAGDASLNTLQERLFALLEARANEDLLRLSLTGSLGIEAANRLEELLESLGARLLRMKLANGTLIAPTDAELQALTARSGDPLIASVACKLVERAAGDSEEAQVARIALRELHAACTREART
jgi:DNA repair exonuclease SbcCD nuclease subunit